MPVGILHVFVERHEILHFLIGNGDDFRMPIHRTGLELKHGIVNLLEIPHSAWRCLHKKEIADNEAIGNHSLAYVLPYHTLAAFQWKEHLDILMGLEIISYLHFAVGGTHGIPDRDFIRTVQAHIFTLFY